MTKAFPDALLATRCTANYGRRAQSWPGNGSSKIGLALEKRSRVETEVHSLADHERADPKAPALKYAAP